MNNRLIAVGDIHGEYYLLENLLDKIAPDKDDTFIFLGDYVDRGLYAKQVVDKLLELNEYCHCEFLKGNHEFFMDNTINKPDDDVSRYFFMTYGGVETIESYGGKLHNIYAIHGDFYRNLKLYYKTDDFIFIHGGLKPNVPITEQEEFEMLMIRNEFIDNPTNLKEVVIFGHTPFDEPIIMPDKIGIDTGSGKFDYGYITAYICNQDEFVFSKRKSEI